MRKIVKKSAPKSKPKSTRRAASRIVTKSKPSNFPYKPALIALAVIGLLYMGYRTLFRPTPVGINQVTGGTGTVTLALTPPNSTKVANSTRDLTLEINAGTQHVSGAQVEITFDPAKCVTPTVTQGPFLTATPLVPVSVANGKITFTFIAPLPASGETAGKSGNGTLATITTGPKNTACRLSFTSNTEVYVTESTTNALASASDATINLPGTSPSPTPTPSPSVTATPTPIPSSSAAVACPSNYTAIQCQAFLKAKAERVEYTQSTITRVKECLRSQPLSYCASKTFISCSATKPVAECLP